MTSFALTERYWKRLLYYIQAVAAFWAAAAWFVKCQCGKVSTGCG